jgi:DNA-binding HxlR family transcriptional regulator
MAVDDGVPYRVAVEQALRLLSGHWVVAILTALAYRPLHFNDLLAAVDEVDKRAGRVTHERPLTSKVMSRTLQRMERVGLVQRHPEPTPLPSVWYEVSPLGRSLLQALRPLAEWAQKSWEQIGYLPTSAADDEAG